MGIMMNMSFTYVNNIFLTTIREMRYDTNKISSQSEVDMIQTYADDINVLFDDLSTNDILFVLMFHYYSLNLSEHYAPEFSLFDFKDYIDDYNTSNSFSLIKIPVMSDGDLSIDANNLIDPTGSLLFAFDLNFIISQNNLRKKNS